MTTTKCCSANWSLVKETKDNELYVYKYCLNCKKIFEQISVHNLLEGSFDKKTMTVIDLH